jgi:hypothetical protein
MEKDRSPAAKQRSLKHLQNYLAIYILRFSAWYPDLVFKIRLKAGIASFPSHQGRAYFDGKLPRTPQYYVINIGSLGLMHQIALK